MFREVTCWPIVIEMGPGFQRHLLEMLFKAHEYAWVRREAGFHNWLVEFIYSTVEHGLWHLRRQHHQ